MRRHALLLGAWGAKPSSSLLARAFHIPAEGEEPVPLYRSENPAFDPFLFIYW